MNLTYAVFRNGKRMLSLLLAVCLTAGLLGYVAQAADEPAEILSFERTNPVFEAEVDPGTERGDLGLPETLRAVVSLEGKALEDPAFIQAAPDPDTAYVYLPDREEPAGGYADGNYIAPEDAPERYSSGETVTYSVWRETDGTPEYRIYGSVNGGEDHWYAVDGEENICGVVLDLDVKWSGTYNPNTSDTYILTAVADGYVFRDEAPCAKITVTGDEREEFINVVVPLKAGGGNLSRAVQNGPDEYTVTVGETFLLSGTGCSGAAGLNVYYAYTQTDGLPAGGDTVMLVSEYGGSQYFARPDGGTDIYGTQGLYAEAENVAYTDGGGNLYLGSLDMDQDLWYVTRNGNNYRFADSTNHSRYMNGAYNYRSSDSGITFGQVSMGAATDFTVTAAGDGNYYLRYNAQNASGSAAADFYLYYYPHDDVHVRAQDSLDLEYGGSTIWNFYRRDGFLVQALTTGDKTVTVDGRTVTIHVEPVEAVQPSNVTVNLFDYWLTGQYADDTTDDLSGGINSLGGNFKFAKGGTSYYGYWNRYDGNDTSGGHNPYLGIVSRNLGTDGYPVFSNLADTGAVWGTADAGGSNPQTGTFNLGTGSLGYLFDPAAANGYRAVYPNVTGLFQLDQDGFYWYDSDKNYAEFDAGNGDFTLYGASQLGFFPFTSFEDATKITTVESGQLNHYFGMTLTSSFRQMYGGYTNAQRDVETVFEFSGDDDVWIFIDGVLAADLGGVHQEVSVRIDFATGFIYVNCDENTPESELYRYENSSAWQKRDHDSYYTTIYDMFGYAGAAGSSDQWTYNPESGNYIFADMTSHRLEFFYLERGHNYSNLEITTNLIDVPETTVYKVDENGDGLPGAEFAVYTAAETAGGWYYQSADGSISPEDLAAGLSDGTYEYDYRTGDILYVSGAQAGRVFIEAKYCGVTDEEGKFSFYSDEWGTYYTLEDILREFGERFFLREILSPDGYRMVSADALLRVTRESAEYLLVCDETYDTGIWASPRIRVLAGGRLYLADESLPDEERIIPDYYDRNTGSVNGSLFAVVLKYTGTSPAAEQDLSDPDNWAAVWGNDTAGHTLEYATSGQYGGGTDGLRKAILAAAAHQQELDQDPLFRMEDEEMAVTLSFLPGDITKYYHMLVDDKSGTEYAIAYYWAAPDPNGVNVTDLSELNPSDIHRVDEARRSYAFTLEYAATVEVANMMNRLYVEKEDEDTGDLVENAYFGLYRVEEEPDGIYYVGNTQSDGSGSDVLIFLGEDTNGDNVGYARLQSGAEGSYVVNGAVTENGDGTLNVPEEAGRITVTIGADRYYISPADCRNTIAAGDAYPARDHDGYEVVNDTGETAAVFQDLEDGCYYVREIWAPLPYLLNTTEIKVRVTDQEIYANAGTLDDGITVARGSGYLISTMHEAASLGDVNRTLSWICLMLRVDDQDNDTFDFEENLQNACLATDRYGNLTDTPAGYGDGMRACLVYAGDTGTMFNFVLDEDALGLAHNTGTRRLYTDVGWSYLEIYQNPYQYLESGGADGVHYEYEEFFRAVYGSDGETVLYYEPTRDLNNLFTRSVYIRVTDPEIHTDVELVKLDGGDYETDGSGSGYNVTELTPLGGAQFILSRTVTEPGEETGVTYYYRETKESDVDGSGQPFEFTKVVWTTDAADATVIESMPPGGSGTAGRILLQQLEEGEYTLTEIRAPAGYNLPADPSWTVTVVYDEGTKSLTYTADTGIRTEDPEHFILLQMKDEDGRETGRYRVTAVTWDNTADPERWVYTDPDTGEAVHVFLNEEDGYLYTERTDTGERDVLGNPVYKYEGPVAEMMYAATYYIPNTGSFTLYKIDGSDVERDQNGNVTGFTAVSGASFILSTTAVDKGSGQSVTLYYAYDEAAGTAVWVEDIDRAAQIGSEADGRITLPALDTGNYRLQETAAPDGYLVLSNSWTIEVTDTGEIRVDSETATTSPEAFILMPDERLTGSGEAAPDRYTVTAVIQDPANDGEWTYTVDGQSGILYLNPADGLLYTRYEDGIYGGSFYQLMRPTVWYIPNYRTYRLPSTDGRDAPRALLLAGGVVLLLAGGCLMWMRLRRRGETDLN